MRFTEYIKISLKGKHTLKYPPIQKNGQTENLQNMKIKQSDQEIQPFKHFNLDVF